MDNRLGEMQVFRRIVESGSFSAAARQMLMTPSTVSKMVARIEERLAVRLIERSTRRLSLTDEGQLFYERSLALLADLDEMEHALTQGGHQTVGTVRVNTSVGFGTHCIEPLLPAFWEAYPNIVVDLSLSDEIVDLFLDRTDIAFRIGRLTDSSLTAIRIGAARRLIVAAPDYLERHGVPRSVADLVHHKCLGFNFRRSILSWPLASEGTVADRLVEGPLRANNGETVRRMALAGAGLARIADFHARRDLAEGRLVEVLAEANVSDEEEIHALYLAGVRMPRRVRVFLDFLVPRLRAGLADGAA